MANWYVYQAHAQNSATGEVLPNAQVEVYEAGTSTLAALASDRSGTSQTNPFNADSNGYFKYYAAAGRYDLVVSSGGNSQTFNDVALGPAESLDGIPDPAAARTALQLNNVRNVSSYSQGEADTAFVDATGDDMTGPLNMANSDPIQDAGNNAIEFDGNGNVTLPGDLTVGGTTTNVNTTNLNVEDPLTLLADGNNTDSIDIGFIAKRLSDNVAMFWDESADEFAFVLTADDGTVTTITPSDYADLHVGGLTADDGITQGGNAVLDVSDLAANGGTVPEESRANTFTQRQTIRNAAGIGLGLLLEDDSQNIHGLFWSNADGRVRISVYDGVGGGSPQELQLSYDGDLEWRNSAVLLSSDLAANGGTVPETDQNAFITGLWRHDTDLRISNATDIDFRNAADTAFLRGLRLTGLDQLLVGDSGMASISLEAPVVIGNPTGGSQGAGTINTEQSYNNGNATLDMADLASVGGFVFEIDEAYGASDGDVLTWNNTAGEWEPRASSGVSFSGARLALTSAQPISHNTVTDINWDAESFDVGGWADLGTDDRKLTVPAGVSYAEFTADVRFDLSSFSGGEAIAVSIVNASTGEIGGSVDVPAITSSGLSTQDVHVSTGPIAVSAGDDFELSVYQFSGTLVDIETTNTQFSVKAIPGA